MCGIGAVVNVPDREQRRKIAEKLAEGIDKRGGHGCGYVGTYLDKHKGVEYGRQLGKFEKTSRNFMANASKADVVLLHARFATCGKRTVTESHPFAVRREVDGKQKTLLWGCHNGVVSGTEESAKKNGRAHDVDSRECLELLADGKLDELGKLNGYGTFAWIDNAARDRIKVVQATSSGNLEILKTDQGPVIIGSTMHICREAAIAAGLTTKEKESGFLNVKTNVVYEVCANGDIIASEMRVSLSEYWGRGWEDFGSAYSLDYERDGYYYNGVWYPSTGYGAGRSTGTRSYPTRRERRASTYRGLGSHGSDAWQNGVRTGKWNELTRKFEYDVPRGGNQIGMGSAGIPRSATTTTIIDGARDPFGLRSEGKGADFVKIDGIWFHKDAAAAYLDWKKDAEKKGYPIPNAKDLDEAQEGERITEPQIELDLEVEEVPECPECGSDKDYVKPVFGGLSWVCQVCEHIWDAEGVVQEEREQESSVAAELEGLVDDPQELLQAAEKAMNEGKLDPDVCENWTLDQWEEWYMGKHNPKVDESEAKAEDEDKAPESGKKRVAM